MGTDYVGSNNINLLEPIGQFGTRINGGKDSASPRYIFTKTSNITDHIFNPSDKPLLKYLEDDGLCIEPKWYLPIIPMILVNGSHGIGTGYSTHVPPFNPKDIIYNLKSMLNEKNDNIRKLVPWFRGFRGTVYQDNGKYFSKGVYKRMNQTTLQITELPIGMWTEKYKEHLEKLMGSNDQDDKKDKRNQ